MFYWKLVGIITIDNVEESESEFGYDYLQGRRQGILIGGAKCMMGDHVRAKRALRARSARTNGWGPGARLRAPGGGPGAEPPEALRV